MPSSRRMEPRPRSSSESTAPRRGRAALHVHKGTCAARSEAGVRLDHADQWQVGDDDRCAPLKTLQTRARSRSTQPQVIARDGDARSRLLPGTSPQEPGLPPGGRGDGSESGQGQAAPAGAGVGRERRPERSPAPEPSEDFAERRDIETADEPESSTIGVITLATPLTWSPSGQPSGAGRTNGPAARQRRAGARTRRRVIRRGVRRLCP